MIVSLSIGYDHAGFSLARKLQHFCTTLPWLEILLEKSCPKTGDGMREDGDTDYPQAIPFVVQRVLQGSLGLLICGTGMGMSMAANRYPGIGAALCTHPHMACLARQHNNANVLVLPGRFMSEDCAQACLMAFLATPFEGGRHERRISLFDTPLSATKMVPHPLAQETLRNYSKATLPLGADFEDPMDFKGEFSRREPW